MQLPGKLLDALCVRPARGWYGHYAMHFYAALLLTLAFMPVILVTEPRPWNAALRIEFPTVPLPQWLLIVAELVTVWNGIVAMAHSASNDYRCKQAAAPANVPSWMARGCAEVTHVVINPFCAVILALLTAILPVVFVDPGPAWWIYAEKLALVGPTSLLIAVSVWYHSARRSSCTYYHCNFDPDTAL